MSLELTLKDDSEITLPAGLAASPLTLEEIGALACIACFQTVDDPTEAINARLPTPQMKRALTSLKARGVFKISMEGKTISMSFDLEPIGL